MFQFLVDLGDQHFRLDLLTHHSGGCSLMSTFPGGEAIGNVVGLVPGPQLGTLLLGLGFSLPLQGFLFLLAP